MARRRAWRDPSLLTKFTLLSTGCLLLVGLVLGMHLRNQIRQRALTTAGDSAALLANVGIGSQLRPSDMAAGSVPQPRRTELDELVARAKAQDHLARVKVWNRSGRVIYSDDPAAIGKRFDIEADLHEALDGQRGVSLTQGSAGEHATEGRLGKLVEAYVPLRFDELARGKRPDGAFEIYVPYERTAAQVRNDVIQTLGLLAVGLLLLGLALFRIVANASRRLRGQAAESAHQAMHDALTGLPNRRAFGMALDDEIVAARRADEPLALLLIDLDGFKELNDTLGHASGDSLLLQVGERLRVALPEVRALARLGGDEFGILLARGRHSIEARAMARLVLDAVEQPVALDDLEIAVHASVGIARFPEHGDTGAMLLQRADVAMYEAKRARTGWQEYDSARDLHSRQRLRLLGELPGAIIDGQLVLHYQPKADVRTGRVEAVEALVRWQHPELGLLAPADFLPLAAQTGVMRLLTMDVLDQALRACRAWMNAGERISVAVNLATADVVDERLPDEVQEMLHRHDVPAALLRLEITEDLVMADPDRVGATLRHLAVFGVGVSLDDFGTGFSSLTRLRGLAVDELKIDRSFVTGLSANGEDAVIVRSTIDLAHGLGMRVVAEGVEDADTMTCLRDTDCDLVQGFFLSRPIPALELMAWLAARRRPRAERSGAAVAAAPVGSAV